MSDLPDLRNEPTIETSRSELGDFARASQSVEDRRGYLREEPRKSPFRYLPSLLAILIAAFCAWHSFVSSQLEKQLQEHFEGDFRKDMPDVSATVEVHSLTNLVEIEITRSVRGKEGAYDFLGDALLEYLRVQLEPVIDRELSKRARRDTDLYAMMVPYQVAITIDKVRLPPAPPPSRLVQEVQHQLRARGYDPGPADGRLGQRTQKAIESFQRDRGLKVDGRATGELLDELRKR